MTNGDSLYNTVKINDELVWTTSSTVFDSALLAPDIYDTAFPILGVPAQTIRKIEVTFYGTNICGTTEVSVILPVICPVPAITASWSPGIVNVGEIPTLTWSVTDATTLRSEITYPGEDTEVINGVAMSGTTPPAAGKTNTVGRIVVLFVATSYCGEQSTRYANVDIICPVPTITASWSPASVITGQSSTLSWATTNATAVSAASTNQFGSTVTATNLPVSGSSPSAPGLTAAAGTISTTITASNDCGQTTTKTVTLTITAPTPTPVPTKTPTPVPTKTPTPAPSCSITVTLSGGGTITAKNPCAQDNTVISVLVNFSRAVSTLKYDTTLTSKIGSCLPKGAGITVKNTNFNDGTAEMTFEITRVVNGVEVPGSGPYVLAGAYANSTTQWLYKFGAGSNTTKGTYRIRTYLGGRASVPGQCQDGKAFNASSNYVSIVIK